MRTNWIGKSVVALSMAAACAVPACDSSTDKPESNNKVEQLTRTTGAVTIASAGDIAVTCVNSGTDQLQIVTLIPLETGTDLKFTDREWTGTAFNAGETADFAVLASIDAGTRTFNAGEQISFNPTGVGGGPEQIFLYQGTVATPTLIWGMQWGNAGAWGVPPNVDPTVGNVSALPAALASANNAFIQAPGNNADTFWFYTGPTTGTKSQLKGFLLDPQNWTGPTNATPDGGAAPACPGNFTVLADPTDAGEDAPADSGAAGSGDAAPGTGGAAGSADAGNNPGTGGAAGSADAGPGTGGVMGTGGAVDSGTDVTGTGGAGTGGAVDSGSDVTGTGGMGTGGATDAGTDVTGTGGMGTGGATTDASSDATGTGGRGTGGSSGDAAADVRADTGTATDAKVDTGTATDAKADSKADVKTGGGGSSGCSCSTSGSTSDSLTTSAWMLALGGIIFTARRRRRKQ